MLNYRVINESDLYYNKIGLLVNCSQIEATLLFKDLNIYKTYSWDNIVGEKICI